LIDEYIRLDYQLYINMLELFEEQAELLKTEPSRLT